MHCSYYHYSHQDGVGSRHYALSCCIIVGVIRRALSNSLDSGSFPEGSRNAGRDVPSDSVCVEIWHGLFHTIVLVLYDTLWHSMMWLHGAVPYDTIWFHLILGIMINCDGMMCVLQLSGLDVQDMYTHI